MSIKEPQTSAQLALDLMAMTCICRLRSTGQEQLPIDNLMDVFNDILAQRNPPEKLSSALSRLLASLHRVLRAEDCPKQDPVLADFIAQVGIPELLVRPADAEADCYWEDRLSRGVSHDSAFHQLRRMVSDSLRLAPILSSEPRAHAVVPDMSAEHIKTEGEEVKGE